MAGRLCDHFVYDGHERARDAHESAIRAEVEREYEEQLRSAGWLKRWWLCRKIESEVEKRLERVAPHGGLYFVPT